MTILRWLLCHLIIITVFISLSLGYAFRDGLKEDFTRLTEKANSLEKVYKSEVYSGSKYKSHTNEAALSSSANERKKIDRSVEKKQVINKPQRHQYYQADNTENLRQQQDNAVSGNASIDPRKANDPWGQIGSSQSDTNKSMANVEEQAPSGSDSIFPPDNYIPEDDGSASGETGSEKNLSQVLTSTTSSQMPDQVFGAHGNTADTTTERSAYLTALANVRQLYWSGKTGQAQAIYEKLMFDYPEQPEAAAELGNIFLQQGNRKAASWAYQNAIPRYLKLHREQEAINLTDFISQYDPTIAESLHNKYW